MFCCFWFKKIFDNDYRVTFVFDHIRRDGFTTLRVRRDERVSGLFSSPILNHPRDPGVEAVHEHEDVTQVFDHEKR